MAPRATLKQDTLVALGADRLAELIVDEASHNAAFKRIVAAALAAAKGPDAVAAIIDRRLGSLEKARGYVDYDRSTALVADLASIVAIASEELGKADPAAGSERLLRFLGGAEGVLQRIDDSSGKAQAIYEDAASRLAALIVQVRGGERGKIVEELLKAMLADAHGHAGTALGEIVPSLDADERAKLDELCRKTTPPTDGNAGGWRAASVRATLLRVRKAIADADDDVDSYIALDATKPPAKRDSLGIAERLMKAGRLDEALRHVRQPPLPTVKYVTREDLADNNFDFDIGEYSRLKLEIGILSAMGDKVSAQALRLKTFRDRLDAAMLRDYVAELPDFEDEEALDEAFVHVATHPRRHAALSFFLRWPRLDLAAKLVCDRATEWEGRAYEVLAPAAAALEPDHSVAATILYRALIDDALDRARAQAYGHAARYLAKLEDMATDTDGSLPVGHEAYHLGLQKRHGRKHAFWSRVQKA